MKYKTGGAGMHAINENSDQEGGDTFSGDDGDGTRVVADYL